MGGCPPSPTMVVGGIVQADEGFSGFWHGKSFFQWFSECSLFCQRKGGVSMGGCPQWGL